MHALSKPRALGYSMPAEWHPHAATWIAWPHNPSDWPGKFQPIPWVYAEIVRHLAHVEDVHILVQDAAAEKRAKRILLRNGVHLARVHFHLWPTNRVWTRDSGPIFLRRSIDDGAETRLRSPTGSSMHGPSMTTGKRTTRFQAVSQNCYRCRNGRRKSPWSMGFIGTAR